MFSVLSVLYNLGESLFKGVDDFSTIFFYEVIDGVSLMALILPSSMVLYIVYQLVIWVTDAVT